MTTDDTTTASPQAEAQVSLAVTSERTMGWILAITGALGLLSSFVLTVERFHQLKDPQYAPACDISVLVSCGSVMKAPEAELFGFPNSLLGIASFAIVLASGVAVVGGAKLPRFYWWGLLIGQFGGLVMVHWLMITTMFVLHTLCPWCVVTWVATIPAFLYTLAYLLTSTQVGASLRTREKASALFAYHPVMLILWFGFIALGVGLELFA